MSYINKMFSHFMRNLNLSTKSLKGNEAKATKIALLSIGSFGSWYLMQKFHPSKLNSAAIKGIENPIKEVKKEISIEKKEEIKTLIQKNPTEITESTEDENEEEVPLNYFKWIEGESFFDNLENYYLSTMNPGAFIEKIKTLAVRDPSRVSQYIQNYGIKNQTDLIEIAKIAAAQSGWGVSEYIQNYGIIDQKALIEIAKIAAAQSRWVVSEYIQNYGIKDPIALIEIVKIAAALDGERVSRSIQKYGITDQKALIEIAKIAAAQSGSGVSEYIQKYGITDQKALIEIAKIAAAQSGWGVSYYIQNYGITDQKTLIEIAKIAAVQDGWGVSRSIQNYGIRDQKALIEIAKIAVAQNGLGVSNYIQNYGILEKDFPLEIANIMLSSLAFSLFSENALDVSRENIIRYLLKDTKTDYSKVSFRELFDLCLEKHKKNLFRGQNIDNIFEKIFAYRGREMVSFLLGSFIQEGSEEKYQNAYKKLTGFSNEEFLTPRILPAIIPSKWIAKENLSLDSKEVQGLIQFFQTNERALQENTDFILSAFLSALKNLDQIQDLSSRKKLEIVFKICTEEKDLFKMQKSLRLVEYFVLNKKTDLLKSLPLNAPFEELTRTFQKELSSFISIPSLRPEELVDKYEKTFGTLRVPCGLEIFQKALFNAEPSVKNTLMRFINSVLLGTFKEERYRTDNNPHLKQIQDYNQEFFNTWKSFAFESKEPFVGKGSDQGSFSFKDFIEEKLRDHHFTQKDLPVLFHFLHPRTPKIESLEKDEDLLTAQNLCIELLRKELSKEEKIKKLQETVHILERKLPGVELVNDLKVLIQGLMEERVDASEKVVCTQDWQDLFLAGSEVGSCQRLDGSAHLNKCLLAYPLDGKNSMIAVKDEITGKTLARSMLRLLWDSQHKKPVLFLDRLYPNPCPPKRADAILFAAKECAKQLNLELFQQSDDLSSGREIVSLGSSCPYEYADAAEGVMKDGKFSVKASAKIGY